MVEFTEIEQEEIINKFLDMVLINNTKKELKNKCDCCKCKNYKNHNRYKEIGRIELPINMLNIIYNSTYKCIFCQEREKTIRHIETTQNHNVDFLNNANIKTGYLLNNVNFQIKVVFRKCLNKDII